MSNHNYYLQFTKDREGGLSKDPNDSASKDPLPDGSGFHTNKGITWATFKRLGPICGYNPTIENFYKMPDDIFEKIMEYFWKEAGANRIDNQAIANLVFQALWGGGHKQLIEAIQTILGLEKRLVDGNLGPLTAMAINVHKDPKSLYEKIHQARLDYLRSLKVYPKFANGWESRMKKLFTFNQRFFPKK